jgi:hypothetical protein
MDNEKIDWDFFVDKNGKKFYPGCVIDIHQTVNGQNKFIIMALEPLDIRLHYSPITSYWYDAFELMHYQDFLYFGESEIEIVGTYENMYYTQKKGE